MKDFLDYKRQNPPVIKKKKTFLNRAKKFGVLMCINTFLGGRIIFPLEPQRN